jgi:hypothetical protein
MISSSGVHLLLADYFDKETVFSWLLLRDGKLTSLNISGRTVATLGTFEKYVRKEGRHIRDIYFDSFFNSPLDSWLLLAARHCQFLTELHCSHCDNLAEISPILAPSFSKLTTLLLSGIMATALCDEILKHFINHCPLMQFFEADSAGLISPYVLDIIAEKWKDLHSLLLPSRFVINDWSESHESAVMNLIAQVPRLLQLCYAENRSRFNLDSYKLLISIAADSEASSKVSPLRLLWVERLPFASCKSIFASCLNLEVFGHTQPLEGQLFRVLGASKVTKVHLSGSGVRYEQLSILHGLHTLELWDVEQKMEVAIAQLCMRSPRMINIYLEFKKRPSLHLFPSMLSHTPLLRDLYVGIIRNADEVNSDDGDSDGDDDGRILRLKTKHRRFVDESAEAMRTFAKFLCPCLEYPCPFVHL